MESLHKSKQIKKPIKNKSLSIISYIFSGISFIPLVGIPFGIVAIVLGIIQKIKLPIILGSCGILFTIVIYGGLFYALLTDAGPYADLKKQLAVQLLTQTRGQILIYKERKHKLPAKLSDMGKPSQDNFYMMTDSWMKPIIYKPHPDGTFELRSSGPDGIPYTKDDIISKE